MLISHVVGRLSILGGSLLTLWVFGFLAGFVPLPFLPSLGEPFVLRLLAGLAVSCWLLAAAMFWDE